MTAPQPNEIRAVDAHGRGHAGADDGPAAADFVHFAGEAAHDLNNLLAVIIANLDLLGEQSDRTAEDQTLLGEALTASMRASELVRDLLTAARGLRNPQAGNTAADFRGDQISVRDVPEAATGQVVLAVEDNPNLRRIVVQQLTDLGYRVLEAEDGPAALMVLNSEPVDLLFTDVVMPGGMSGFDLARLVLSRWPSMRALITSGFPELGPSAESTSASKLHRLAKPYRMHELAAALAQVFESEPAPAR